MTSHAVSSWRSLDASDLELTAFVFPSISIQTIVQHPADFEDSLIVIRAFSKHDEDTKRSLLLDIGYEVDAANQALESDRKSKQRISNNSSWSTNRCRIIFSRQLTQKQDDDLVVGDLTHSSEPKASNERISVQQFCNDLQVAFDVGLSFLRYEIGGTRNKTTRFSRIFNKLVRRATTEWNCKPPLLNVNRGFGVLLCMISHLFVDAS